jgi:hypothetical protein
MSYTVEILFGKEQIIKYRNGETLNDYEKLVNRKKFEFVSRLERDAFYQGLSEANGWIEFEIIKENNFKPFEEQIEFDYWGFIEKNYPNYYNCDSILLRDILTLKLDGEEITKSDEEYIKNWNARNELLELEKELLGKAFENYFNTIYPEIKP